MNILSAYENPAETPGSEAVRIAQLLKLSKPLEMDDLSLAQHVSEGFSVKAVDSIKPLINEYGLNAIYSIVSEPTLRRARKTKKLSREHSERLYEISRVIDQAAKTFHGRDDQIQRFMTRPNQLLEGKSPFEVARSSSAGANAVINLLERARAGVAI